MALQAIKYERGRLQLLDQRLLPFDSIYLDVPTPQVRCVHRASEARGTSDCVFAITHRRHGSTTAASTISAIPVSCPSYPLLLSL